MRLLRYNCMRLTITGLPLCQTHLDNTTVAHIIKTLIVYHVYVKDSQNVIYQGHSEFSQKVIYQGHSEFSQVLSGRGATHWWSAACSCRSTQQITLTVVDPNNGLKYFPEYNRLVKSRDAPDIRVIELSLVML